LPGNDFKVILMIEQLLSEKERAFLETIRRFVETDLDPISLAVENSGEIPPAIVEKMRALGLFGLAIPTRYNGLGFSTLGEIMVYEELTKTNACFRSRIGTSNGIGSMGILFDGTEAQKQQYLPRIASGEKTAAFALTEPDAGSDAGSISTFAQLDGDTWIINGSKLFITNGDCADVFTTIVVTDEDKRAHSRFSAFIIERGMPGFSTGAPDKKMGLRGSQTTELVFRNCKVPRENIIGGQAMVGQGFKTAMRVLDKGRLAMGACAAGASQKMLALCIAHIQKKARSGKSWDDLQAEQFTLADLATETLAARQMLYYASQLRDQGSNISLEASMVKLFCTETASRVADRAMDIFGEESYLTKNQIEMFLRDVRLYRIFEGTSEIQRLLISKKLLKEKR
jgi:acyl-CoA dehydrogenase